MPIGRESSTVRENSTLDLVLDVWRRRRWLAFFAFAVVFLPALTIARALPDIYRATATVLVDRQPGAETFTRPGVTGQEIEARLQAIKQEMLSRALLAELVRRFNLYADRRSTLEGAIGRLRNDIRIEVKAEAKAVDQPWERGATVAYGVSYQGRDPETVARVANALAAFHVGRNDKMRERRASGAAEYLRVVQAQVADAVKRLDEQERRIGEFKRRYGSELAEHMPVNLTGLERLNTELRLNSDKRAKAMERRAALEKELTGEASPDSRASYTPAARLARLRQELRELRSRFTDKYPEVIRVKREIADLVRVLAKDGAASETPEGADPSVVGARDVLREVDEQLVTLKVEEERLRREAGVYQVRIDNVPRREQELQELSRNYTTSKELYHSLLKRQEEAQLASSMEPRNGEQFRILDPATPPTQPVAPNRNRVIMLGALLALAAAVVVTAVAERSRAVFHTADELRAFTKVPVLASIPLIVTRADRGRRRLRVGLLAASALLGLALAVAGSHHFALDNEQLVWMFSRGRS